MTEREISVSVGVVTFRSDQDQLLAMADSLGRCFERLGDLGEVRGELILVCNDDPLSGLEELQALAPEIRQFLPDWCRFELVSGQGNVGYGAAQNLGLARSTCTYHLFLNPDVVLDASALLECVTFLIDHPETAVVLPSGYDTGGGYAWLAKRDPSLLVLLLRALSVRPSASGAGRIVGRYTYFDQLPSDGPVSVRHGSGCFMFASTETFRRVGGFDERFFLYFEDYDLSRRIAPLGCLTEVPTVRIVHHGGRTARRGMGRIAQFLRSAVVFFNRYGWRFC